MRWYGREEHDLFDVCADDHCQRYHGVTKITSAGGRAGRPGDEGHRAFLGERFVTPAIRRRAAALRRSSRRHGMMRASPTCEHCRRTVPYPPLPPKGRLPAGAFDAARVLQYEGHGNSCNILPASTGRQRTFSAGPSNIPARSWRRSSARSRVLISAGFRPSCPFRAALRVASPGSASSARR